MPKTARSHGDLLAVPLTPFIPKGGEGALGLIKVLSSTDDAWFAAALNAFGTDPSTLDLAAPVLERVRVEAFPAWKGRFFARGPTVPDTWIHLGNAPLTEQEKEFAQLHDTWKGKTGPKPGSQAAYQALGRCSEGLDGFEIMLAREWRMRFALDEVLAEYEAARQRRTQAKTKKPIWRNVRAVKPRTGPAGLRGGVQSAYGELIGALGPKSPSQAVRAALQSFFVEVFALPNSREFRDEIASLGADVGEALGLQRSEVYALAESAVG